jgi:hypothetical protein
LPGALSQARTRAAKSTNAITIILTISSELLELIRQFTVLGRIEAQHFLFLGDPQSDYQVDDLEQDEGADACEGDGGTNSHYLLAKLLRVAEEEPIRANAID